MTNNKTSPMWPASSPLEFFNKARVFPLKFSRDSTGTVTHVLAFNRDLWARVKE